MAQSGLAAVSCYQTVAAFFHCPRQRPSGCGICRAQITDWKAQGDAQGSLGIGLGACATGNGAAPDATGSVYIRLERGGDMLPLIADGRIADLIGADTLAAIGPCEGSK